MNITFNKEYELWMQKQINQENGTMEMLRSIWYPVVGSFDHLYPEWEVRDFNNGYRYLDLAFLPGDAKGDIEIQDYGSHARDLDTRRFKDLCRRQSLLSLDDWVYLPIAYLSIREEPALCKQLILSFIGKFVSTDVDSQLNSLEAETVRYARRLLKPFTPNELAVHLRVTARYARRLLHGLVERQYLLVVGGNLRFRTYQLNVGGGLWS
jgi:hypothetical protein